MNVRCSSCFEQYDREYEVCPYCGFVKGTPAAEPFYLNPGTVLQGRYVIGVVLGFGGYGIIYKAWDNTLQTTVAVKEFFPSGIASRVPGAMDVVISAAKREIEFGVGFSRFIDEARSMAKFGVHGSIVNVFAYFEENQTAYIVMEYLSGITLSEYLKTASIDIKSALSITLRVCDALKSIHAAGIVHRDVSPDNIFICSDNRIKLIDFGTARFSPNENEDKLMTVILKPGYAPPEQYDRINAQGPWTDIYAIGATLYYMLTGVKPDESTNRKITDTLVPPVELNPAIPENISNSVMKALALDKHMRFKNVVEFEKGLKQEIRIIPLKKEIAQRKRRRLITVLSSLLVITLAITVFLYFFNRQREEEALNPTKISVWYELSGDDTLDEAKRAAYAAVFDTFRESYESVEIEVYSFEKEEYVSNVMSAIRAGEAPSLFETTDFKDADLEGVAGLGEIVKRINLSGYCFLDKYPEYFPSQRQLPLGFTAPVVYINNALSDVTGKSIWEDEITDDGTLEQFLAGESEMILSSTAEFYKVQDSLAGLYRLLRLEGDSVECQFKDIWSVGAARNVDERKAAMKLLEYMLSDNAQDCLYIRIRNQTGIIPLNKAILEIFADGYTEFDGFFDRIDSFTFVTN